MPNISNWVKNDTEVSYKVFVSYFKYFCRINSLKALNS